MLLPLQYNFIMARIAKEYVVYGLDKSPLLTDISEEEVRQAVINHAKNQMFTSQCGMLTVVSYEPPLE